MTSFLPRGLIAALQFLTRIPTPVLKDYSSGDVTASAKWYPAVGLLIGLSVAGAYWVGSYSSTWVGGLCALVIWIWITGALHLDGLADTADGLGAAHADPERFLAVTKEVHTGSFGVIALVIVLLAKIVFLAHVTTSLAGLVLIPAYARLGAMVWRNMVPPLGDGRGKDFSRQPEWTWVCLNGAALIAASAWFAPALLIALPVLPAIAFYWRWRLGGMTGDCHGASIEITEVTLLGALIIAGGIAG